MNHFCHLLFRNCRRRQDYEHQRMHLDITLQGLLCDVRKVGRSTNVDLQLAKVTMWCAFCLFSEVWIFRLILQMGKLRLRALMSSPCIVSGCCGKNWIAFLSGRFIWKNNFDFEIKWIKLFLQWSGAFIHSFGHCR